MANNFVSLEYLNINTTDCILKRSCSNNNNNNPEYKYKITTIPENHHQILLIQVV
jgi:hypothetical protein